MIMNKGVPKADLNALLNEKHSLVTQLTNKNVKLTEKMKIKRRIREIDKEIVNFDPTLHHK